MAIERTRTNEMTRPQRSARTVCTSQHVTHHLTIEHGAVCSLHQRAAQFLVQLQSLSCGFKVRSLHAIA
jgi:hypothetical protein